MPTPVSKIKFTLPLVFLVLLQVSASSHAELYKWVDANGRTHYSDNKLNVGKGEAQELRVAPPPPLSAKVPEWKRQEEAFKRRQAASEEKSPRSTSPSRKGSWPGRRGPETNATKCALAHDVTSGAVVHTNGKKTDANDRAIAQRDMQRFCR